MSRDLISHFNCKCLNDILDTDESVHNFDSTKHGTRIIQSLDYSRITFQTFVRFRNKIINSDGMCTKDRKEEDFRSIPLFFCPICGTKSKLNIPEGSYYVRFKK